MKLMVASLVETVDSFLHAGYISAYPRPLEPDAYPPGLEAPSAVMNLQLDLVEALRLGEPAKDAGDGLDTSAAVIFGGGGGQELLLGALTLTGIAFLVYLLRRQIVAIRTPLVPAFSMMALLVLMSAGIHCGDDPNETGGGLPTEAPWEGVTPRSYVHPEQATLAIIHGIIGPALANIGEDVATLANLRDEVALPSRTPSEGEAYALTTYGIDGFGNELDLEIHEKADVDEHPYSGYTVTSAGPDGTFGTDDDISADVDQTMNDSWGWTPRNAYYLMEIDGQVDLLFHRWNHKMFEFQEEDRAAAVTDSDMFDVMSRDRLRAEQISAMTEAYESIAVEADRAPVVLQVFAIPEG